MPTPLVSARIAEELPGIFPGHPLDCAHGQLKVTLDKEVSPAQFLRLAELALATQCAPKVVCAGAGVSVVFS